MKDILLMLLLGTTSGAAQSLVGTWEEAATGKGPIECPDVIHFEARRYVYLNDCHAPGQDGIVETGDYEVEDSKIRLHNRQISSVGSQLESSEDPLELSFDLTSETSFDLTVGHLQISFQKR